MIADTLPICVASADTFDDQPEAATFPEEKALVARCGDDRRRELITTRHCARCAPAQLMFTAELPITDFLSPPSRYQQPYT